MKDILTLGKYYKKSLNRRVRKVPISISGFTCPNIDGTVARGGCTYCLNESFSPNIAKKVAKKFYLNPNRENIELDKHLKELTEQFKITSKFLKQNYKTDKFIVYFQSFTNTYADIETLKALYTKALSFENVIGLSIGTRADSIDEKTLDLLQELNRDSEIWVEYGIQSVFDKTLERINRAENIALVEEMIKKTKERGIKVCGHLIYGLPDENQEMMLESFKKSIDFGVDSIKIHPCYVVKDTALAKELKDGSFKAIDESLYIDTVVKSLELLPENIIIQRITAGIDDESLIAPKWCFNKNYLMNKIKKALIDKDISI